MALLIMTATKDATLILFTDSYPYDFASEDSFLDPEIPHLLKNFEKVIIFPKSTEGKRVQIPEEIQVKPDLAEQFGKNNHLVEFAVNFFYAAGSQFFYREFIKKPTLIFQSENLFRMVTHLGEASRTKRWLKRYITTEKINLDRTIFYTYWCKEITSGIGYVKLTCPELMLISRAHGVDIYNERFDPPYIPLRPEIFQFLNKVFLASADGQQYLQVRYPEYEQKFEVSKLGISNTGFIARPSDDNVFRIVSCSNLIPVKRIELLIRGLRELGVIRKDNHFSWTHIGKGPLMTELNALADSQLPKNVQHTFLGYLPNSEVLSFYKDNPVDIFVNVSESEGGNPVSIMEAQCCGIPAIATAAGGNKEIVSGNTGFLLSPNPAPGEIAEAIITMMNNPEELRRKKERSKKNWEQHYNADKNFEDFVHRIVALRKEKIK
jgi:colanic acid/amylovoran biosynthesis glycosyltransferase